MKYILQGVFQETKGLMAWQLGTTDSQIRRQEKAP
jgi:uncharacterized protein YijF (DUF1287 family)